MREANQMERISFDEAKAKLAGFFRPHVSDLNKFCSLFDTSLKRYGEENKAGLNLVGIYDRDLAHFIGLSHLGLMMPRARLKLRYSKAQEKLDLEVGILLTEYGRGDKRQDPFERMRMDITFEEDAPYFQIRRFKPEEDFLTGRETVRPVDQGLELLLRSIIDRLKVPQRYVQRVFIDRPKRMKV